MCKMHKQNGAKDPRPAKEQQRRDLMRREIQDER